MTDLPADRDAIEPYKTHVSRIGSKQFWLPTEKVRNRDVRAWPEGDSSSMQAQCRQITGILIEYL